MSDLAFPNDQNNKGAHLEPNTSSPQTLVVGDPFEGGLFAGRFFIGAQAFLLIVSPRGEGECEPMPWGARKAIDGANSYCDGMANTQAMAAAGSKLAKWALALQIAGKDDWHLPSRLESLVLFGELGKGDQFVREWYWTSTQCEPNPGYAWFQSFVSGYQDGTHKDDELRARAVRSIPIINSSI
jgi:hypothetical protein